MRKNEVRSRAMQWILPCVLFLLAVIILLINYAAEGKREATRLVENKLLQFSEDYRNTVFMELNTIQDMGKTISLLGLGNRQNLNQEDALSMTNFLVNHSQAYMAIMVNRNGKGINHLGEAQDISAETYFSETTTEEIGFAYARTTAEVGADSIVITIPCGQNGKKLLAFYPNERLWELFAKTQIAASGSLLFSIENGEIARTGELELQGFQGKDNVFELFEVMGDTESTKSARKRMAKQQEGSIWGGTDTKNQLFAYVPLYINEWYFTVAFTEKYAASQVKASWKTVRNIVKSLTISMIIFVIMVAAIACHKLLRIREVNEKLETKADTDLLTELYNKIATERKIKEFITHKSNGRGVIFVLDIDNFKKINDTRGHAFGDEVLKTIGLRLKAEFRVSDIVGRAGGDEFIIFLKDIESDIAEEKEIKRVEKVFHNLQAGQYTKYTVTASIGCAAYPVDGNDFESLYKAADKALYQSKQQGKNRLTCYSEIQNGHIV